MADGESKARCATLALGALGVVFGDIGTSPLYAFETAVMASGGVTEAAALGVASIIIWSLLLIVTLKYICVVMRADYHGEGGVFALLALLLKRERNISRIRKLPLYALLLLFGAAMLFGDGTITPAISVLSAMEGLEVVSPSFDRFVIPGTVAILATLFAVQRLGTGRLGFGFGWVMLLWFTTLAITGFAWLVQEPRVLAAFNPLCAINFIRASGIHAFFIMGATVLAVTGVEALYADMGHFGRPAISRAWHFIALPALVLNYLGQAALAIRNPSAIAGGNPFFEMVPSGPLTIVLVVLATLATVIASQALISGVFSLSVQAEELQFMPRFNVFHTSRDERGQVYVPVVNWVLGLVCLILVLTFRSSANLAAAYGLAVVITMVITTITLSLVTTRCWQWKLPATAALIAPLIVIEGVYLAAAFTKLPDGGYFPLLIGGILLTVMLTWRKGLGIILHVMESDHRVLERLIARLAETPRVPGQTIFVSTAMDTQYGAARAIEFIRREGAIREEVVLLSLVNSMESDVDMPRSVEIHELGPQLWHVAARHGYMQEPHGPEIMKLAHTLSEGRISAQSDQTFYLLPRQLIVEYTGRSMSRWRRALFGILSRNVSFAPDYFYIPHDKIVDFTWMMKA